MATKNQYEFFETRYTEEIERMRDLQKKAQIYLSIISIIASVLLVNISDFKGLINDDSSLKITTFVFLADLFFIVVFLINSVRLKSYIVAFNPSEYINEVPDDSSEYTDTEFYDNRVADFIHAIETNQDVNAEKAQSLKLSEYGLFGLVFIVLIITFQILL
jgi:hypothetical protein